MSEVNDPSLWLAAMPWPDARSHKHARGRLGVVSGGPRSTGAARLAARAGLRAGAGLVRVFAPEAAGDVLAPTLEAVMLAGFDGAEALADLAREFDAVVIGPAAGVDAATADNVRALAGLGAALVLDADALTVFADKADDLAGLTDRRDVLTPHEGEFERLFPSLLGSLGRGEAACVAAGRTGAVMVLKGHETVIAAPDGRLRINRNGSPWLATAGSGDVLAGIIGGLIAQRMDSFESACAAVWIHAEAAGRFGPGLTAEDLPDLLPGVLGGLWRGGRG